MHAFVVLDFGFPYRKPGDGLGESLGNDVFCVEWDVKP